MFEEITVLVLDDDERVHEALQPIGQMLSVTLLNFTSAVIASDYVREKLDSSVKVFSIVDLFLLGNAGQELSAAFIEQVLVPNAYPYGRFTSAPDLVPEHLKGEWVVDKRLFLGDDSALLTPLIESLNKLA